MAGTRRVQSQHFRQLDQILDRSLAGYRIPENIRKSLGNFAQ
jgi:hypothetical protein